MWAVLLFILSLFCEESPRFLCKKGTPEKACEVFARLWGLHPMDPAIQTEMRNVRKQLEQEEETTGWYLISSLKELFTERSNLRRIIFILCLQLLSQWSGPNSVTIYSSLSSSDKHSNSTVHAAVGSIVFMYFIGVGWAMGWNSIQYLVTAETFPLRVRLCGASLATCIHFGNRIGTSKD
ncbi:hypothetical protein N7540_002862 [Penicillium herquei]|nr:hypothetical protein N7540_002862 [Penicillium herquei]